MPDEPRTDAADAKEGGQPGNERLRILRMIQEGKISPEQGADLLAALGRPGPGPGAPASPAAKTILRILITERGGERVNVRIPLNLLRIVTRFIPQDLRIGDQRLSRDDLMALIEGAGKGELVQVADPSGSEVLIRVE